MQEELVSARGPEELAAQDDLAAYVASSATLVSLDLSLLDPSVIGERQGALGIQRSMVEAKVNEYENDHPSGAAA